MNHAQEIAATTQAEIDALEDRARKYDAEEIKLRAISETDLADWAAADARDCRRRAEKLRRAA